MTMYNKDMDSLTFDDLQRLYTRHFSLGRLNSDLSDKLALISLICYTVQQVRKKNPRATYRDVINKLYPLSDTFLDGIAIVCEDFAYGCTTFPTFGLSDKQIIAKIKEILDTYLPF